MRLLPQADQLTLKQLDNSLPDLLVQAAKALGSDQPSQTDRLIDASPVHGLTRFHQDFNLNELLIEYAILRRVTIIELSAAMGRAMSLTEQLAIAEAVDIALRQAAIAFTDHQASELRTQADAMTKYLSFLSHDLRGGLNGAMLLIEVLRRDLERDPRYRTSVEDLDNMRRSMMETVATMDRFLHAEKLRRGRFPVNVSAVSIRTLLHDVARGFAYLVKDHKHPIEVVADAELTIESDRELLTIIVQNLLANAIKYGDGKPTVLHAACSTALPRDVTCRISVIDHGPGISQERLQTLFMPFSRGETYGQKGMGLGLFIARQAAELIGARLFAESKLGEGTQFHVDLPKQPPSSDSPDLLPADADPSQKPA